MDDSIIINYNSNIAKDSNDIRISFYSNIGFFVELSQMLEYNLRKLLCYEQSVKEIESTKLTYKNVSKICKKYDKIYDLSYIKKWTLGTIINNVIKKSSLENDVVEIIKDINVFRAKIVHKIFQINIITNNLYSAETVKKYIENRLTPMIQKTNEINNLIIKIVDLYRIDLRHYKNAVHYE